MDICTTKITNAPVLALPLPSPYATSLSSCVLWTRHVRCIHYLSRAAVQESLSDLLRKAPQQLAVQPKACEHKLCEQPDALTRFTASIKSNKWKSYGRLCMLASWKDQFWKRHEQREQQEVKNKQKKHTPNNAYKKSRRTTPKNDTED